MAEILVSLGEGVSIALELRMDGHTVNDAVITWGEALLEADVDRVA